MNTIIKDPALIPFFISKDKYCYTVMEIIKPQEKYLEEGSKGKDYEKAIGHYSTLGTALKAIARGKLDDRRKQYDSIKEYINTWQVLQDEMKELLLNLGI